METSVFIAKIFGLVYLSFAVGILFSGSYYKKMLAKLMDDSSFMLFGGILALIAGFLIINSHNIWIKDWTVLVTIIGWLALVKGVLLIAFPKLFDIFKPMLKSENIYKFIAPAATIMGLVFGYFGFLA